MPSKIDQKQRARRAWKILVDLAKHGERTTYKGLTDKMGLHHRSAQFFLGYIQEWCAINDAPPLQALVYAKATGVPGSGYIGSRAGQKSYSISINAVHRYNWSKKPPF